MIVSQTFVDRLNHLALLIVFSRTSVRLNHLTLLMMRSETSDRLNQLFVLLCVFWMTFSSSNDDFGHQKNQSCSQKCFLVFDVSFSSCHHLSVKTFFLKSQI